MNAAQVKGDPFRKGNWMQTASGGEFYPLDPRPEEIHIEDIAHSLAMQCRYAGHCKEFYSVAEHSVLMAEHASEENKLVTLLHDASEAYLVDIPRPIKGNLVGYSAMETRLMRAIGYRFGFSWPMPDEVKELDSRILLDEALQNMVTPPRPWGILGEPLGVKLCFWSPRAARAAFLQAYEAYSVRA